MIAALLTLATSRIGLIGIAVAAVLVFYEGLPLVLDGRVDQAREAGKLGERLVWQEKQQRAIREKIQEETAKQAELDAIARVYRDGLVNQTALTIKVSALEASLAAALAAAEQDDEGGTPGNCGPFIPRDVSRHLDAIGK